MSYIMGEKIKMKLYEKFLQNLTEQFTHLAKSKVLPTKVFKPTPPVITPQYKDIAALKSRMIANNTEKNRLLAKWRGLPPDHPDRNKIYSKAKEIAQSIHNDNLLLNKMRSGNV